MLDDTQCCPSAHERSCLRDIRDSPPQPNATTAPELRRLRDLTLKDFAPGFLYLLLAACIIVVLICMVPLVLLCVIGAAMLRPTMPGCAVILGAVPVAPFLFWLFLWLVQRGRKHFS